MDLLKDLLDTVHRASNNQFQDMGVEDAFIAGLIVGSLNNTKARE